MHQNITMAVTQNTLIGSASGKIGGAVMSKWKGLNVLKSKPLTVANPKTDLQIMRRAALSVVTKLFRAVPAVVNLGFKEQAVGMSEFNAFSSTNLKGSFAYDEAPDPDLDITLLKFAKGTITPTTVAFTSLVAATKVLIITWPTTGFLAGQSATDKVMVVAASNDGTVYVEQVTTTQRSAGTATITLTGLKVTAGDDIAIYTSFYNSATRKASDSIYHPQTAI